MSESKKTREETVNKNTRNDTQEMMYGRTRGKRKGNNLENILMVH